MNTRKKFSNPGICINILNALCIWNCIYKVIAKVVKAVYSVRKWSVRRKLRFVFIIKVIYLLLITG